MELKQEGDSVINSSVDRNSKFYRFWIALGIHLCFGSAEVLFIDFINVKTERICIGYPRFHRH